MYDQSHVSLELSQKTPNYMDQFSCVTTFILWQGIPILEVLEMVSIGSIEFCAIVELSSSAL